MDNSISNEDQDPCVDNKNHLQSVVSSGGDSSLVLDPAETATATTTTVVESESRNNNNSNSKLPSSQYKGVVPQPNGRWGAQIYEKHQRIWLGTFNLESEAARAYDSAAQRFRGRDAVTNFKPLSESDESDAPELHFLGSHSKAEIVDMLRKHTYADELQQSKRSFRRHSSANSNYTISSIADGRSPREHLFDKTVTPSDVGKLNRLVIPKQHAEKHFPMRNEESTKGLLLNFEDDSGKVWRFRYSYWNSSQSYVLTKGWSRFVKEKRLQAGDVVSFEQSGDKQLFIDCKCRPPLLNNNNNNPNTNSFRLFGVDIIWEMEHVVNVGVKRSSSRDLSLGLDLDLDRLIANSPKFFTKKQCVGA